MKGFKLTPLRYYVLMMLLVLALFLITGGTFFFYVLILLGVTLASMYAIVQLNVNQIYQNMYIEEDEAEIGDEIRITLKSNNTSILPVAHAKLHGSLTTVHAYFDLPSENLFFNPYQIVNVNKSYVMTKRGIYTKAHMHTVFRDPLSLFHGEKHFEKDTFLVVYPKVYELNVFDMPNSGFIGTRTSSEAGQEDFSSLKKVRKYAPGDSIKRVHWKLSSKRNEIFVKEFDASVSSNMTVFLDGYEPHYEHDENKVIEDRGVSVAASIIKYALRLQSNCSLVYHTDRLVQSEHRDMSTYPTILKDLVTFNSIGKVNFSDLLLQEAVKLEVGSFIVLITTHLDQAFMNTLFGLKRRRFKISLIMLEIIPEATKDLLISFGIKVYIIDHDDIIQERLEVYQ